MGLRRRETCLPLPGAEHAGDTYSVPSGVHTESPRKYRTWTQARSQGEGAASAAQSSAVTQDPAGPLPSGALGSPHWVCAFLSPVTRSSLKRPLRIPESRLWSKSVRTRSLGRSFFPFHGCKMMRLLKIDLIFLRNHRI